jgi:hypothetical protein
MPGLSDSRLIMIRVSADRTIRGRTLTILQDIAFLLPVTAPQAKSNVSPVQRLSDASLISSIARCFQARSRIGGRGGTVQTQEAADDSRVAGDVAEICGSPDLAINTIKTHEDLTVPAKYPR